MPDNEPYDWADDDSMSAEETMRRFESLGPEPTTGPPAGNYVFSFGEIAVRRAAPTDAAYAPRTHREPLTPQPVPAGSPLQ